MTSTIPLIILGGSDRAPTDLPPAGKDFHALCGYKGVDIRIGGRPLVALLVERLRTQPRFDKIAIAGPERIYAGVAPDVQVIDTDASVGRNIRAAMEAVAEPGRPIAFIACDVLPDPVELAALMADYDSRVPCDLWFPLIHAPDDTALLGASAWKPEYRIEPAPGEPGVQILPSHLMIADPEALRLGFIYSLMEIAYQTRNRPVASRRRSFVAHVLGGLLYQDLRHLLAFRLPTLTWSVLSNGLRIAHKLRQGGIARDELEASIGKIVVKARHRRRHPERGVRLPVVEGLSLAVDIDTEEERRALERSQAAGAAVPPQEPRVGRGSRT